MTADYTYILVDFFCIIFPLLFSFHPNIKFTTQFRYFWPACTSVGLAFIGWDIIFTQAGIWHFNPRYVLGWYLAGLPLEEILFFICIPYACVFTYHCFGLFLKISKASVTFFNINVLFSVLLLSIGVYHLHQLYTSVTFISLACFLATFSIKRSQFLKPFFLSFFLILFPFFISNGILTGAFTEEPVVVYNDMHNLKIRLLTIPVEDVFYGMLMLLLNVAGYEYLKHKRQSVNPAW